MLLLHVTDIFFVPGTCSMDPTERIGCGGGGQKACLAQGCCYDSGTLDMKWCFYHRSKCNERTSLNNQILMKSQKIIL